MKQKYLAVALSTALVASLTACGSDSKSNYAPTTPPVVPPTTQPETKPDPKPEAEKPTEEAAKPGTEITKESNTETKASLGGDLSLKSSVGTQHYIRNEASDFDKTANPNSDSTGSVANFETLKNRQMANIVIARDTVLRDSNRFDTFVGTEVDDRTHRDALQRYNTNDLALNNVSNRSYNNNGLVALLAATRGVDRATTARMRSANATYSNTAAGRAYRASLDTTNLGKEEMQSELIGETGRNTAGLNNTALPNYVGAARIFGANFNDNLTRPPEPLRDNVINARVYVGNARANRASRNGTLDNNRNISTIANLNALTNTVALQNVQFGRVTTNLEDLSSENAATVSINGRRYFSIDRSNADRYLNVGRNNDTAVNNYFYRGLNETDLAKNPQKGIANYQGQALMYGIDNSFRGVGGGNSNAVVQGGGLDMLGNFVEAKVNFDTKKVDGNVYNVWRLRETDRQGNNIVATSNVVDFQGDITGPNSVWGTAQRTYDTVNPVIADFQGNFFGANAEELGGSFNSVRRDDKGVAKYGDANWGGVFGATKITSADGYTTE